MEQTFVQRTQKNIKNAVDPVVLELLAMMVLKDIPAHDIFYIEARIKELFEAKFKDLMHFNLPVQKLRKDILKKSVDNAKSVKVKLKKDDGKETHERNLRCEKMCQHVTNKVLDLVFSDEEYLNDAVADDERLLLQQRMLNLVDGLMESITYSINQGLLKANRKLWNGKNKDEITMKQIDNVIK